ncbi:homeobox protein CDX-4 [Leopardus geoffroyi]|uniref:homeobox protein CDX-4 n=1 Tax=Leopardus geoffroyi TaxID=46844 RepID=UPI001E260FC0|nr:homeobox protein CDX-4 [Leopardus geoffroyi]
MWEEGIPQMQAGLSEGSSAERGGPRAGLGPASACFHLILEGAGQKPLEELLCPKAQTTAMGTRWTKVIKMRPKSQGALGEGATVNKSLRIGALQELQNGLGSSFLIPRSCLLEKEAGMYLGTLRNPAGGGTDGTGGTGGGGSLLPASNSTAVPAYAHFMAYPHMPSMDSHGSSLGGWGSPYSPPREDWNAYPGSSSTMGTVPVNDMTSSPAVFGSPEYNLGPVGGGSSSGSLPARGSGSLFPVDTDAADASSSNRSLHSPYAWMRKTVQVTGKTRTKEKYRVVYTDHQRLELEKEFHCNRYITIRRKSELAVNLGLSERQVKIWFQNRRAKERKMIKKKISQFENSGGSVQSDSGSISPGELPNTFFTTPSAVRRFQPIEIQQVIVSE